MATRRDTATGRKDSLGRQIKVSSTAAGNTPTAPAPAVEPVERTRELVGAEIAATHAAITDAQATIQTGRENLYRLDAELLAFDREQLTADFHTARTAAAAAHSDLRAKVTGFPPKWTPDHLSALSAAEKAVNETSRTLEDARSKARKANGWSYDAPELEDPVPAGRRDRYGYPMHDPHHDTYGLTNTSQMIRVYASTIQRERELGGSNLAPTFQRAIESISHDGYGVGEGLPCTNCGQPQYGYDDQDYYCRDCR